MTTKYVWVPPTWLDFWPLNAFNFHQHDRVSGHKHLWVPPTGSDFWSQNTFDFHHWACGLAECEVPRIRTKKACGVRILLTLYLNDSQAVGNRRREGEASPGCINIDTLHYITISKHEYVTKQPCICTLTPGTNHPRHTRRHTEANIHRQRDCR